MYAVISGEKTFTLLPPTDILYLQTKECQKMIYNVKKSYYNDLDGDAINPRDISIAINESTAVTNQSTVAKNQSTNDDISADSSRDNVLHRRLKANELELLNSADIDKINWIETNPDDSEVFLKNPDFKYTHPIRCTVRPGEILYIPGVNSYLMALNFVVKIC
jgi:hypothetical protein